MHERIAGMDFGTTLIKAVWKPADSYKFKSTKDVPIEHIIDELKQDGIKEIQVEGLGCKSEIRGALLSDFEVRMCPTQFFIQNEQVWQVEGTKKLLRLENDRVEEFLLVGMGTGTSYTWVNKDGCVHYPLGNPIGGGFISGLAELVNVHGRGKYARFVELTSKGKPLDRRVKDLLPEKEGTFEGELVVANFDKVSYWDQLSGVENVCATIVHCVAVTTIRDVMLAPHVLDKKASVPLDVVYVGSTVAHNPVLKKMLADYSLAVGRIPHFPKNGEFALAMGAYLRNDVKLQEK